MQKKLYRKLALNKETLRILSPMHLNHVGGGFSRNCTTETSNPTNPCGTSDTICPATVTCNQYTCVEC